MKSISKFIPRYVTGAVKASYFSEETQQYFSNTKKAAFYSFIPPFLLFLCIVRRFALMILCKTYSCSSFMHLSEAYIAAFMVHFMIVVPKFLIFFGLVWQLCKMFKQTEFFCAFMAANNCFYIVYAVILFAFSLAMPYADITGAMIFQYALIFYVCLVVFFLAHNVLRLESEIAWLVPMAFLFAHALVKIITTKEGSYLAF